MWTQYAVGICGYRSGNDLPWAGRVRGHSQGKTFHEQPTLTALAEGEVTLEGSGVVMEQSWPSGEGGVHRGQHGIVP